MHKTGSYHNYRQAARLWCTAKRLKVYIQKRKKQLKLHEMKLATYMVERKAYWRIKLRLQLHGAIYRPDSFVLMLRYCPNLKAIRYESMSLNRIVADKSHRVIVALFVSK